LPVASVEPGSPLSSGRVDRDRLRLRIVRRQPRLPTSSGFNVNRERAMPNRAHFCLVVTIVILLALPAHDPGAQPAAEPDVVLAATADVSICLHPREVWHNRGGGSRVRLKGIQHLMLVDFDLASLGARAIESAWLVLTPAGDHKLREMGVSTVGTPWTEGRSAGDAQPGEVCLVQAARGRRDWAGPGSTLHSVIFGAGGSRGAYAAITARGDGTIALPVPPELLDAMRQGQSFGLAVTDEKGQTMANNDVYSREHQGGRHAPRLELTLGRGRMPRTTVRRAEAPKPEREPRVRVRLPDAPSGERVAPPAIGDAGVWIAPLPLAEQIHPATGACFYADGSDAYRERASEENQRSDVPGSAIWGGGDDPVRLTAPRRGHAALQLAIGAPAAAGFAAHIAGADLRVALDGKLRRAIGRRGGIEIAQVGYVLAGGVPYADPLVPATADAPDRLRLRASADLTGTPITDQRIAAIVVDLIVAADAEPGTHTGELTVSLGRDRLALPVELTISEVVLPAELTFDVSLNTYGSPGGKLGDRPGSDAFLALERQAYRLAHAHDCTIAVVPYSQSGSLHWAVGPEIRRDGATITGLDWTAFDRRWGPYLDGSAFAGLPRDGVPLDHLYLPMHENHPLPIAGFYRYDGSVDDHWRDAPPIGSAFPPAYREAFVTLSRAFTAHLDAQRDRHRTAYHVYLNNKIDFRRRGRGSSWWRLDEPAYRDDFLALRYFAEAFREGRDAARDERSSRADRHADVGFRIDLSYPEWRRGFLDGLVDLNVTTGLDGFRREFVDRPRERFGEAVWRYGTTPQVTDGLAATAIWAVDAWLSGADGLVPWQTIGRQDSWREPEATAILLPGRPGMARALYPTLRLKLLRAGRQLSEAAGIRWGVDLDVRRALRRHLAEALGSAATRQSHADDAPTIVRAGADADLLDRLCRAFLSGPRSR
jgi:hypothetical protein